MLILNVEGKHFYGKDSFKKKSEENLDLLKKKKLKRDKVSERTRQSETIFQVKTESHNNWSFRLGHPVSGGSGSDAGGLPGHNGARRAWSPLRLL